MSSSQYSTSTRAHKESDLIGSEEKYNLGNYQIWVQVDDTVGPAMEITATCKNTATGKIGTKTIQTNTGTQLAGWYMEVNSTTVDVYGVLRIPTGQGSEASSDLDTNWDQPIHVGPSSLSFKYEPYKDIHDYSFNTSTLLWISDTQTGSIRVCLISSTPGPFTIVYRTVRETWPDWPGTGWTRTLSEPSQVTINGKTAYYAMIGNVGRTDGGEYEGLGNGSPDRNTIWTAVYGRITTEYEEREVLIGRFAVNTIEAGGGPQDTLDDPDDVWEDPEDYDPEEDPVDPDDPDYPDPDDPDYPDPIYPDDPDYPDPDDPDYPDPIYPDDPDYPYDPDDPEYPDPYQPPYQPPYYPPTKTLYLTVTGALSGRHNDPLSDLFVKDGEYKPYIPADKETVKSHGHGGDGGNGGGGGAGASTVVVHHFATSKANSKEITAIARRHGYGSGGGKGGRGGSGCILIYY